MCKAIHDNHNATKLADIDDIFRYDNSHDKG